MPGNGLAAPLIRCYWGAARDFVGATINRAAAVDRVKLLRRREKTATPQQENLSALLTVAARALAKHGHRGSESWWDRIAGANPAQGSPAARNVIAARLIERVLDLAVWGNLHQLPGELPTFEVRSAAGYGARWVAVLAVSTADAVANAEAGGQRVTQRALPDAARWCFRGLVEPQMEDGHSKGWRHDLVTVPLA